MIDEVEKAKLAQLDLLIELKRICEKNGINYILSGGTLIGAIRHNGYIPWDDDIDVSMLRKDYEKFSLVCQSELHSDYHLVDWYDDAESPIPFLKLKIKGTRYVEELSKDSNINKEIFIDIFPFDNAPDSKIKRLIQKYQIMLVKRMTLLKCGFKLKSSKSLVRIVNQIMKYFSRYFSIITLKSFYNKVLKRYNQIDTREVVNMCSEFPYNKVINDRNLLEDLINWEFEGEMFKVPRDYDKFLKARYGDYMKLPPVEDRVSKHGVQEIDLGKYEIRRKVHFMLESSSL